ncbi:MAG: flagellar hook-length control protein FliK, partial [Alphaproteobacteria bacterium]|nr:flagellar hook-length control protein FliK [Alphaproteobacteria bacterium]
YNASANYASADRATAVSRQNAQNAASQGFTGQGLAGDQSHPSQAQIFAELTDAYAASNGISVRNSLGGDRNSAAQNLVNNGTTATSSYARIGLLNVANDPLNSVLTQSANAHDTAAKSSYALQTSENRANKAEDSAQQARTSQHHQQIQLQQNRALHLRADLAEAQQDRQDGRNDSAILNLSAASSSNNSRKNAATRSTSRDADSKSDLQQMRSADASAQQDAAAAVNQTALKNDAKDTDQANDSGQQAAQTSQDQAARTAINSGKNDRANDSATQEDAPSHSATAAGANLSEDSAQSAPSNAQANVATTLKLTAQANSLTDALAQLKNAADASRPQNLPNSELAQIGGALSDAANATEQAQTSAQSSGNTQAGAGAVGNGQLTPTNLALTTQLQTILSGAGISARIGGNNGTVNNAVNGTAVTNALLPSNALVSLAEQIDQADSESMGDGLAGNLGRDLSATKLVNGQDKALLHGQNGSDLDFSQILTGANGSAGLSSGHHNLASTMTGQTGTAQNTAANSRLLPLVEQVARPVFLAATQGQNEISIQMQPHSMGRVGVSMKFGEDGKVTAHVTAERPETLALLKNDASGLQQALQDAGFQADLDGLNFSLSSDGRGQQFPTEQQNSGAQAQNNLVSLQEIDEAGVAWQSQPGTSLVDISI